MKHSFIFLTLFFISYWSFGQENEEPPTKGQVTENQVVAIPNAYKTISTVLNARPSDKGWSNVNWQTQDTGSGILFSTGKYRNGATYQLESPDVNLPLLRDPSERYNLYLQEWYELEAYYDQGEVQVSTDAGRTWETVSVRSGRSKVRTTTINMTAYAGKTARFRLWMEADQSNTYAGWNVSQLSIKHETLLRGVESKAKPGKTRSSVARTTAGLNGTLTNLDAQRFPRFIFGNVNVLDGSQPVDSLDESNFFVKEFVRDRNDTTKVDTLAVPKDQFFKVFAPNSVDSIQRPVDIVFLMDNSGSMREEKDSITANVASFAQALENAQFDYRIGICHFPRAGSSTGDIVFFNNAAFYDNDSTFLAAWDAAIQITGGIERSWDALYFSATEYIFRPSAQRIFILLTDETITNNNISFSQITDQQVVIDRLIDNGIRTYAVVETGTLFDSDFGTIATATGGRQYDIYSPFNDILEDISTQIENTYIVRYAPTNPEFDGLERRVEITVDYQGSNIQLYGDYTPGAAPSVLRTDTTLALSREAQQRNIPVTIEVQTYDWKEQYPVDVTLFYRKVDDTTAYKSLAMTRINSTIVDATGGSFQLATWRAQIPGIDVLDPGISYYVRASDGDITTTAPEFIDRDGFPWAFAVLPNLPPVVNHTPIKKADPKSAITFTAEVIDNTNNVDRVFLSYREEGGISFIDVPMTLSPGTNNYSYTLAALNKDVILEYYIVGIDNFGVPTTSGSITSPYKIEVGNVTSAPSSPFFHNIRFNFGSFTSTVTLGRGPLSPGDRIVAYYTDDLGAPSIGGVLSWTGSNFATLVASGDNPSTPEKDGFADGEVFTFGIIRGSDSETFNAAHEFYPTPNSTAFRRFGSSFIRELKGLLRHSYTLKQGLNIWSTYLDPIDKNMDAVFSSVLTDLGSVADSDGDMYMPGDPTSTLNTFVPGYGYSVFMNNTATITVEGIDLDPAAVTLSLDPIGTIIGTPYPEKENVESVIRMLVDTNIYILDRYLIDDAGAVTIETYSPAFGFNGWTDKNMEPGRGYYAYTFAPQSFTFPAATGPFVAPGARLASSAIPQQVSSIHRYMHILIPQGAWTNEPGQKDEVRLYADNKPIGKAMATTNGSLVTIDGTKIKEGEPFELRFYEAATLQERKLVIMEWKQGDASYENHRIAVVGTMVDETSELLASGLSIFPNPVTDVAHIVFKVDGNCSVALELVDMQGKVIRQVAEKTYEMGLHQIDIDMSQVKQGLYLLKVRKGDQVDTHRLMIE